MSAAQVYLAELDRAADPLVYADASLLVAELLRGQYEQLTEDRKARRAVGKEIDQVARAGLSALESIPESSERYRLKADLYSTMIRSRFRGMKYQPMVETALAQAVALDAENAAAWVSLARRPLFAKPSQGGDLTKALELLNTALQIDPDFVAALMFRGTAFGKMGAEEAAEADWSRAVALNPNVAEARAELLDLDVGELGPAAGNATANP